MVSIREKPALRACLIINKKNHSFYPLLDQYNHDILLVNVFSTELNKHRKCQGLCLHYLAKKLNKLGYIIGYRGHRPLWTFKLYRMRTTRKQIMEEIEQEKKVSWMSWMSRIFIILTPAYLNKTKTGALEPRVPWNP